MEIRTLVIPERPNLSGFKVSSDGRVFNENGSKLTLHSSKGRHFIRICKDKDSISINLSRCILLAFKPKEYKPGLITIHLNGDSNDFNLSNLAWGTRKDQAILANDRNPQRFKDLHKSSHWTKIGRGDEVRDLISKGFGYKDMKSLGISTRTYYKYLNQ